MPSGDRAKESLSIITTFSAGAQPWAKGVSALGKGGPLALLQPSQQALSPGTFVGMKPCFLNPNLFKLLCFLVNVE